MKKEHCIITICIFCASLIILYLVRLYNKSSGKEAFSMGTFPQAPLNADIYKPIGKNQTTDNSYSDIWWKYPDFKINDSRPLTNNLRFWKSPDNGTAMPAEFDGAMYYPNKHTRSNEVHFLPEAETGEGVRVNYYRAKPNLLYFSNPTNMNVPTV